MGGRGDHRLTVSTTLSLTPFAPLLFLSSEPSPVILPAAIAFALWLLTVGSVMTFSSLLFTPETRGIDLAEARGMRRSNDREGSRSESGRRCKGKSEALLQTIRPGGWTYQTHKDGQVPHPAVVLSKFMLLDQSPE
jgi:hypothetical protein